MKRRTLLAIVALAFGFSAFGFLSYTVSAEMERAAYFREQETRRAEGKIVFSGPYCYPDRHPGFLFKMTFLIGITTLVIAFGKGNIFPTALLLLTTWIYGGWYSETQERLAMSEYYVPVGFESYFLNASFHDVVAVGLVVLAATAFTARAIGSVVDRTGYGSRDG